MEKNKPGEFDAQTVALDADDTSGERTKAIIWTTSEKAFLF